VATYFVYRCGYLEPTNVLVRRYEDKTVLDWFRRIWPHNKKKKPRSWHDHVVKSLGVPKGEDAICFVTMFDEIAEEGRAAPESIEDVARSLDQTYHYGLSFEEHCVQLLNDDDEIDMVSYFFDDEFLRNHADLAAYPMHLLNHGWQLPDSVDGESRKPSVKVAQWQRSKKGRGAKSNRLYSAHLIVHDGPEHRDLDSKSARYLAGARVPDLCRELLRAGGDDEVLPYGLQEELASGELGDEGEERAFVAALRADPDDNLTWSAYADWLTERDELSPNARLLSLALPRIPAAKAGPHRIQVGEHVVQLIDSDGAHWFAFDDLWSGAHPALADSLLRYATSWDMLSTGDEERWE
jgi:uncharacterized protein (TIGR02996 family)